MYHLCMKNKSGGRRDNQQYKAFMVFYILLKLTDKDHPLETKTIQAVLDCFGIQAAPLSIQRDIHHLEELLSNETFVDREEDFVDLLYSDEVQENKGTETERRLFPFDGIDGEEIAEQLKLNYLVEFDGSKSNLSGNRGFKMSKRPYTTMDLELLIEAINSMRTISQKKADHLTEVVKSLANIYEFNLLSTNAFVPDRKDVPRDGVYESFPQIQQAIKNNKQISFFYMRYAFENGAITLQKSNSRRMISPIRIIYNNGVYYTAGIVEKKTKKEAKIETRIFRIDKMRLVRVEEQDRAEQVHMEEMNLENFSKRSFNMFKGTKRKVTIKFVKILLDTMIERFDPADESVTYWQIDENHFAVKGDVEISDQFFSWITGFRKKAEIVQPKVVRDEMQRFLLDISEKYMK